MVNKSFTSLLNRVVEERQTSPSQLAAFVERPYSTFRKWMAGTSGPDRTVIIDVCQRLGEDPKVVLGEATAERLGTLLSLKMLQDRYDRQRSIDSKGLYEIVSVSGALCHNSVIGAGIASILTVDPLSVATIQPIEIQGAGWSIKASSIKVYGGEICMMIEVWSSEGKIILSSEPLNDITLDNAIKLLAK